MRSFSALATGRESPNRARAKPRTTAGFARKRRESRAGLLGAGFISGTGIWDRAGKNNRLPTQCVVLLLKSIRQLFSIRKRFLGCSKQGHPPALPVNYSVNQANSGPDREICVSNFSVWHRLS